ncbi:MAG: antibiotic biosynthesis monooxygenase family protein [Gordonia sp. (in: high G+C Gram-positive bacteria)]|uniref:putative quinol monooxygenase n=1 Tax=Gordonia sp. (in: high G+C Gram-positive bacteria) TaxID=84139 RepID=UPI0039E2EFC9
MTCQAVLAITAKEGKYDELREWLVKILPDTRGFQGCVSVEFYRNQDDPQDLVILEKWNSRADYEAYLAWRTEEGILGELGEFIDGELTVRYFDPMGV